jgi:Zn-dependent protease with chaperone function
MVRIFPGRPLDAFCGGLLRPAIYISEGTLREATAVELRAILEHEVHHHQARRDPLRLLLARVVSDAFRPLPPLATLAERHFRLADLAADAAAVQALGDVQPLASALVRFDESASLNGHGIAPERVEQLVRRVAPEAVPSWLLAGTALGLAGIASLAISMLLVGWHPDQVLPQGLELAAMAAAFIPACIAARRADAWLRPA